MGFELLQSENINERIILKSQRKFITFGIRQKMNSKFQISDKKNADRGKDDNCTLRCQASGLVGQTDKADSCRCEYKLTKLRRWIYKLCSVYTSQKYI